MSYIYNLAKNLEGHTIGNWKVEKKISHKSSTGGTFSIGYEVCDQRGRKGFLKALDYSSAFKNPNTADALHSLTSAFIFERDLLNKCTNSKLKYVVQIIDSGHYEMPDELRSKDIDFCPPVDYIVLEMADESVRNMIDLSQIFDCAWALRSLHNVAVGIEEMHGLQIAHQDVKPSNILVFNEKQMSKIGDVGRSSSMSDAAKHDEYNTAGDINYSPFEQLYGSIHVDWKIRRFSCDMFMFGNLIMTYFNNISITSAVLSKLPLANRPQFWADTYDAVLPQIERAFSECIQQFNDSIDTELRIELMEMVKQLCCPNLSKRGDVANAHLGCQQYSLRKYITKLDLLARKYEYQFKKVTT